MIKLMLPALALSSLLALAAACGDSTGDGNDDDDGSGNSGNSGTGNSGTGNSGTGNSGNTGPGDPVTNCAELCALAPVDSATGDCVADYMVLQGYDFATPACADTNNGPGCLACYDAVDVSDADCVAVHTQCF